MPVGSRLLQLLLLLCLITNVLAQAVDEDINDAQAPPPPAVPETPEHPENDIHLRPPPQPHPDIIDVAAPEQPEDPSAPPGELDPPPPGTDPVSSLEEVAPQPPSVDGQPPPSEGPPPTEDEATPPEVPEEPVSDGAPPSDEQPQPPRGPHNPWRVPSHGQPAVEIKAGHSFNFSWTPSTEGTVNLELWQIEESTPVPKFLLACELSSST